MQGAELVVVVDVVLMISLYECETVRVVFLSFSC